MTGVSSPANFPSADSGALRLSLRQMGMAAPSGRDDRLVASSRDLTDADNGQVLECTGTVTLTIPVGLSPTFACKVIPFGTTSIAAASASVWINGTHTTLTRAAGSLSLFEIVSRPGRDDSYVVSGSAITAYAVTPVADFTGTPLTGTDPQVVAFTDASTNTPTSWAWEKNSGAGWVPFAGTPTIQSPSESLTVGTWSIRLTATNLGGSNVKTRTNYVVIAP